MRVRVRLRFRVNLEQPREHRVAVRDMRRLRARPRLREGEDDLLRVRGGVRGGVSAGVRVGVRVS